MDETVGLSSTQGVGTLTHSCYASPGLILKATILLKGRSQYYCRYITTELINAIYWIASTQTPANAAHIKAQKIASLGSIKGVHSRRFRGNSAAIFSFVFVIFVRHGRADFELKPSVLLAAFPC